MLCKWTFQDPVTVDSDDALWQVLQETQVRILPWASRGHVTTRSMSLQHLRSPMLTFATKKLPTGANEQKEDAVSFATVRAVLIEPLWLPMRSQWRQVLKHDCNMMLSHSNDSNHCQLGHLNSSQSHLVQVVVASLSENHDDRRLLSES